MIFIPPKFLLPFVMLLATSTLQGQVLVKITADKDHILVGEALKLTIEARMPLGEKLTWVSLDSIAHFEWIDKGKQETTDQIDGKKVQQEITVTSYDTGNWQIPRMNIKVGAKTYSSDTLGIRVSYNDDFNPEEEYRDIKEPEPVMVTTNYSRWWIFAGGLLLLVMVLVILFIRRKSRKKAETATIPVSAYEEAMKAIYQLRNQKNITEEEVKSYYTRMNDILRNFITRQFHIPALEETNSELVIQMRSLDLPPDQYTALVQALRIVDFVKFAQYLPRTSDTEIALGVIEETINSLHKISQ